MDVDIALVTEIDRRKDNVLIFGTGKSLNERFTPCETSYDLTLNEDFVAPSKIPASKDRVVFKNQKTVPVHERFTSYKKRNWDDNNRNYDDAFETRKWLEESLRSFSKQRRRVVSPKSSRNKKTTNSKSGTTYSEETSSKKNARRYSSDGTEYPKPQQKAEANRFEAMSGKKTNRFSSDDTKVPKSQRKTNSNYFEVALNKMRFSPDIRSPKSQRKTETNLLEVTSGKKIRFSTDIKSPKPQRKTEANHFEVTSSKRMNRFSSDDREFPKPQRKSEANHFEVTPGKKVNRFSFGDFESRKPEINLIVTSDKKMKKNSADDSESTTQHRKVEINSSSDKKMNLFLSGDLESIKPYEKQYENCDIGVTDKMKNGLSSGDLESITPYEKPKNIYKSENDDLEATSAENVNQFLAGDLDSIKPYETPKTNFQYENCDLEVTLREKMNRSSQGDSKSLEEFTDGNKLRSVENEYTANSDCTCKGNGAFKRPWRPENTTKHVSFGMENEYLQSYDNYGFGRQRHFNSSPFHYYRKDIHEVRSYTWKSAVYQWNRDRPTVDRERTTKEQLDDEIDQYMSEVKLKPPVAEEDDLDSFVEEYIMETEKVLSLNDSEFDLQA